MGVLDSACDCYCDCEQIVDARGPAPAVGSASTAVAELR